MRNNCIVVLSFVTLLVLLPSVAARAVVYEDPDGTAEAPHPSLEAMRTAVRLASGGFQKVSLGEVLLNAGGNRDAAIFVAVVDSRARGCDLGIDMTGDRAGASYMSTDRGVTFSPLSSSPIVDGNAMIRIEWGTGSTLISPSAPVVPRR